MGRRNRLSILLIVLLATQTVSAIAQAGQSGGTTETAQFVSYHILQHKLPSGSSQPWTITSDPAGDIWFVEQSSNKLGMYNPHNGSFFEYQIPTPGSLPQGISVGDDGSVWFAEVQASRLGNLPPGSNQIREYPLPKGDSGLNCGPIGITARADAVWVTCEFSNQIDEFTPSKGTYQSFDLPIPYSAPLETLFDRSGNFWFTAANALMLGYATTSELRNGTTEGIQEFAPVNQTYLTTASNPLQPSPIVSSLRVPSQIAFSPDGRTLWITEHSAGAFDKYEIASKTLVKYFTSRPIDTSYPESLPNGIAVGSDGIVWIAEHYGNSIARFDPVTEQLTEYQIPCCNNSLATTLYLTLDNKGSVWFSEFNGDAIGELVASPGALGPSFSITPSSTTMSPDGVGDFTISAVLPAGALRTNLHFVVSGITSTGALSNLTASFSNPDLMLAPGASASGTLVIKGHGLFPGIYYLTVGGRAVADNTTESVILKLTVPSTKGGGQTTLLYGLIVGVSASVIVVGVLAYRRAKASRRV